MVWVKITGVSAGHVKVLLINHGSAGKWGGGDGVQIRETARELRELGHKVDVVDSDVPDARGYDIAHIFNCRLLDSFKQQMKSCKGYGVPTVVSPIWVSIPKALWGSRATMAVLMESIKNEERAEALLTELKQRRLKIQLEGQLVDWMGNGSGTLDAQKEIGQILAYADGIVPNSWMELKSVQQDLGWSSNMFEVAHYGVRKDVFEDADVSAFRERVGIDGEYIIQGGRIEPAKNQAMLCWALRKTEYKLVLVGSSKNWPAYGELCKEILGNRLVTVGHMEQTVLAGGYKGALVHVLPSWMETCGLVTLEAAITGTPVVGSNFGHELEYLKNDTHWCDPADPASVLSAVEGAIEAGRDSSGVKRLRKRILKRYTWNRTARRTLRLYNRVLNK